jgi:putative membrane-bound dehydrogenase-like protein
MRVLFRRLLLASTILLGPRLLSAQQSIPHAQDRPPGPPLSPGEAVKKMTVPPGFSVELVAAEPDLVNPVAMTFDERGRIWVTESLEYPRAAPGPGRDRVKILEDTDRDGRVDKVTVFAEGLNIPSGIAVGHGGVWVANSPDILFMQDTDGDGKADKTEVVVTGFGRTDTHELPNSLTWGPDGWLYGLNGVFNHSHVKYPAGSPLENTKPDGWKCTCTMFRIDPRTREFQLFCEGTSNPWGIAFDNEGSAFVSACVIDHLWHLVETGYYHRQGGPYPPFTWKIESIVKHKHQKAAYCGLAWFDSDAYPEKYREKLYMGNIHGNCINVDKLARDGSTYFATPEDDFLSANDAWFMPVAQKVGPDGCLYVLDWYDQYHCYQDARRDPAGIERSKGRLYRVRYKDTPRAAEFNLSKESDEQLIARLGSPNVFFRDLAQRLLTERNSLAVVDRLLAIVLDKNGATKLRRHAIFALIGCDLRKHDKAWKIPQQLLKSDEAWVRSWALRGAGIHAFRDVREPAGSEVQEMPFSEFVMAGLEDESPDVRLQGLILVGQLARANRTYIAYDDAIAAALVTRPVDPLLLKIAWQAIRPYQDLHPHGALTFLHHERLMGSPAGQALVPRIVEFALTNPRASADILQGMFESVFNQGAISETGTAVLRAIAAKLQSGEVNGARAELVRQALLPSLTRLFEKSAEGSANSDVTLLGATLKIPSAITAAQAILSSQTSPSGQRLAALNALIAAGDKSVLQSVAAILNSKSGESASPEFRGQIVTALGRLDDPHVAEVIVAAYPRLEPEVQPKAVELLTQRAGWAKDLLAAIGAKKIPTEALGINQVRKLLASRDRDVVKAVETKWGKLREKRNPRRDAVIAEMRTLLLKTPGDAHRGQEVFKKICGQCHKIYGEGQEVGPDITVNGRSSFDQLLSNVFDPSLVIGVAYQARTVVTTGGRVVAGLVAEESDQRLVLKMQGGKQEVIPRSEIEEMKTSELSLMPEDVEKTLKPQEIADLFAFITLDKPPADPAGRQLPGVREIVPRNVTDPARFEALLSEVAPGFTTTAVGEGGLGLLKVHFGREGVIRTHPLKPGVPCMLTRTVDLPAGKKSKLRLSVAHDPQGDWQLIVKANGEKLYDGVIGPKTTKNGWLDLEIDLSAFAGKKVNLELLNYPNHWSYEFGYWGRIDVVTE